jgi:hypothetical protein
VKLTKQELIKLLNKYHIPYQNWGKNKAKPIEKLVEELKTNECSLVEKEGNLVRIVSLAVLDVFYKKENKIYKLYETKQIYKNGRTVIRNLPHSVYEKLKPVEDPIQGAKRALQEELGISSDIEIVEKEVTMGIQMGMSFPGLLNNDTQYFFEVILPHSEFNPQGYTEIQKDKTNYFEWNLHK